jgi:hypothetical protein
MLKYIALNVELKYNARDTEISEYDVQEIMATFLKNYFSRTEYSVKREVFGKHDCAIINKENDTPAILYELKTFTKPKESLNTLTAFKKIKKDFVRLRDGINNQNGSRGYFILVCKKRDIRNVSFIDSLSFINDISDKAKKVSKKWSNIDEIKIRPSRNVSIENTIVLSWEVK